jgi:hypothetical protein
MDTDAINRFRVLLRILELTYQDSAVLLKGQEDHPFHDVYKDT